MAQGKREEQRELLIGQAWTLGVMLFGEHPPTQWDLAAFVRTGQPAQPQDAPQESPELQAAMAEVERRLRRGEDVWATLTNPMPDDWEGN